MDLLFNCQLKYKARLTHKHCILSSADGKLLPSPATVWNVLIYSSLIGVVTFFSQGNNALVQFFFPLHHTPE